MKANTFFLNDVNLNFLIDNANKVSNNFKVNFAFSI